MKYYKHIFFLLLFFISIQVFAQPSLPVPTNIQKAYDKGTRDPDGMPGPNYWQNTANYDIHINFSPETRLVSGAENIDYTNNSPDTLKAIWFKVDMNLYKKGDARNSIIQPQDVSAGIQISKLMIDSVIYDPGAALIRGTNMIVRIKPLMPHQHIHFNIDWSYALNETSHIRTGEVEKGSYFIAYFFPRIAVFDDIDGWNRFAYNGEQEFYNDFCNFNVNISVPKNYVVWATGNLDNVKDVLSPEYVQRIKEAEQNDAVINIIDTNNLKQGNITANNPVNTWHFTADDVTEFVFATSDKYVWKSTSLAVDPETGRRTRVDAVFDPRHKDYDEVIDFARETVQAMSYIFPAWPYPYPHETIYDGLDQMEYPMMVNDNPLEDRASSIELTDHEIFHTMFPFYMGTNETKYAWMDEGWATIGEWLISPIIDSTLVDDYGMEPYDQAAGSENDIPIMVVSTNQYGESYFLNSYPKPAMGYLYVKDRLGDSLFTKALHHYMEAWHGKHPMPLDFFNCMNVGAGKNMNWFWKKWFYDNGYPDLAIDKVTKRGKNYTVLVESKGDKPTPVDLTFTFDDETTQKLHRSIAVWEKGNKTVELTLKSDKKLKEVKLGSTYDADTDSSNNVYMMK
ncbi:MAG: peptidase [Chitinophagaceae bacterium]|nr:MAG: peptidase [Chitinophagaceae bacterium]